MESSKNKAVTPEKLMFLSLCGLFFFIPVATSPAVIMGSLMLAVWVFSGRFIHITDWLRQKWALPVIAIISLAWIGLLYTDDFETGLGFAKKTHYWLYAFAVSGIAFSVYRAEILMKAYAAGVSFTSLLFILQNMGIVPMRPPYSVGLLNRWAHISFSLLLVFGVLLMSFFFRRAHRRGHKAAWLALMAVNTVALSLLLSDSGHLAFIVLSPLIIHNLVGKKYLTIFLLSVLMAGALFLSPVTRGRLDDAISGTASYGKSREITPVGGRYYMWSGALKIYLDNPLFGIGTGGYLSTMKDYRERGLLHDKDVAEDPIHPHSSFLYMAVSYGIPGVAALLWLFAVLLRSGWRNRDSIMGFSVLAFSLVLIIGSMTDTQIMQVHTATLLSAFTGLSGAEDAKNY